VGRDRLDVVTRFDIYLVDLEPTRGSEIRKTRPCVIISPDEMNRPLRTVIIAPLTSTRKGYPSRVSCQFENKAGEIVLDQIRTVDKTRLAKRLGTLDLPTQGTVTARLVEMFSL
jgi:mRNA interferase MazF